MKKNIFGIVIIAVISLLNSMVVAQDFTIIPKANDTGTVKEKVKAVGTGKKGKDIWNRYNSGAESMSGDLGAQFASGIMNWNTILNYAVYVVRVLFGLALIGGVASIMWAGYVYATGVFTGNATQGHKALKSAIIGVAVVLFSFAMIQLLTHVFKFK